ncbi:hypothetical protein [Corynebacterium auris]|uniref:hypothetical protein n=1 Tax=Corynebacterium auris TaxID=44750 RepID=UPI0025B5B681|nr:hypothetical protein [Corynebacterium auris]
MKSPNPTKTNQHHHNPTNTGRTTAELAIQKLPTTPQPDEGTTKNGGRHKVSAKTRINHAPQTPTKQHPINGSDTTRRHTPTTTTKQQQPAQAAHNQPTNKSTLAHYRVLTQHTHTQATQPGHPSSKESIYTTGNHKSNSTLTPATNSVIINPHSPHGDETKH